MGPLKCESLEGVQGSLFTQSLSNLKEVWHLDSLVRAHTLLAVMADRTSSEHQLNLLRAYTFVLQIWRVGHLDSNFDPSLKLDNVDVAGLKMFLSMGHLSIQVSMAVCHEVASEMGKSQPTQPPLSAESKRGKDKGKGKKVKDVSPLA